MDYAEISDPHMSAGPHEERTAPGKEVANHPGAKHPKPEVGKSLLKIPAPIVHKTVELRNGEEH